MPGSYLLRECEALAFCHTAGGSPSGGGQKLIVYDPKAHRYENDKPVWVQIEAAHFVLANHIELEAYKKRLQGESVPSGGAPIAAAVG
jgi:hypothetical protein